MFISFGLSTVRIMVACLKIMKLKSRYNGNFVSICTASKLIQKEHVGCKKNIIFKHKET